MAVKIYKPKTNGQRHKTSYTFEEITKTRPERSLIVLKKERAGRNSAGRITVRHRGGGERRQIRLVDFKRDKMNIPAKVSAIEYDPNRTARLALLTYADGEKRYIIAPIGVKVGDTLLSGPSVEIRPGNNLPLANIPVGTMIHAVELHPGKGAQFVRSAGTSAQLLAKEGKYAHVRMPRARCVWFCRSAAPRSVRSATWNTAISSSAKPDARVTWDFVLKFAELRCLQGTIRMVVVKVAARSVCLVLRPHGVSRPSVTRRAPISARMT